MANADYEPKIEDMINLAGSFSVYIPKEEIDEVNEIYKLLNK